MKNTQAKMRPLDQPYEVWTRPDGWEWRVLKKWQYDDNKQGARWFCGVKSPFTYGSYEQGDVYVKDIKNYADKTYDETTDKLSHCNHCFIPYRYGACDNCGKEVL